MGPTASNYRLQAKDVLKEAIEAIVEHRPDIDNGEGGVATYVFQRNLVREDRQNDSIRNSGWMVA